jgi:hypothetical protein
MNFFVTFGLENLLLGAPTFSETPCIQKCLCRLKVLKGAKKIKIKKYLKCFVINVSGLTGRYCNKMFEYKK